MYRSIRWTLQMWHAAILAAVLVAFGSVMFYYLPLIEYRRIEDDLTHVAFRVSASLRPVIPPNLPRPSSPSPVTTDIQNLAAALNSKNLSDAQKALSKLQKDLPPGGRRGPRRFRSLDTAKSGRADAKQSDAHDVNAKSPTAPQKTETPKAPAGRTSAGEVAANPVAPAPAASVAAAPAAGTSVTGNPASANPATNAANPDSTRPGPASTAPANPAADTPLAVNGPAAAPSLGPNDLFREGGFGPQHRPELRVELTDDLKSLFDEESDNPYYFIIWHPDGKTLIKSRFAPATIDLPEVPENRVTWRDPPSPIVRQRGEYRELIRQSRQRGGINILVGRSIAADVASLHEKKGMVALVGVAVLAAGLLGGLWFTRRAIRPIEAISATAADISLSNLSRRIDVTGTQTELTGLAQTLNKMFDRIESAFNQQVRFTADASHELRTPVAVILSHSELALDKPRSAEELRETIETCRRSALRMRSLIESLLTLARFDSGEVTLDSRPFDLVRTVGDCVALVKPLAAQRRITIQTDLPPAMATGDPDRIAQVITNLLTNALRYNHDQGQVLVSLHCSPAEVVLCVADTGIGIPPENLAHIFERFYRVDNARSRKDGGVGLGLAICKSIVMAHGGSISVSSHLNQGTKFEVRLPKAGRRPPGGDDNHREPGERKTSALAAGALS